MSDDWSNRLGVLGATIRRQRQLAKMSLRQLSEIAHVSNPYLSQIERGLHEPSVRVLRSIAKALDISAEDLLDGAGMLDDDGASGSSTEDAITADPHLTPEQKNSMISVYRAYRQSNH